MASEEIQEHKNLFNIWIKTLKVNSTRISKTDLEEIKRYLIMQRDGVDANITFNLKRRIKSNKFVLANFASGSDCVCVIQKSNTRKAKLSSPVSNSLTFKKKFPLRFSVLIFVIFLAS